MFLNIQNILTDYREGAIQRIFFAIKAIKLIGVISENGFLSRLSGIPTEMK